MQLDPSFFFNFSITRCFTKFEIFLVTISEQNYKDIPRATIFEGVDKWFASRGDLAEKKQNNKK